MGHKYAEIAFTPNVMALQTKWGSRTNDVHRAGIDTGPNHVLGPSEAGFISRRDSFYLASVGEADWPYVQLRGGPEGFVRVLDEKTIGFADFNGSRQYVSVRNLLENDRTSLIFMDYPNRTGLTLLGRARLVGSHDSETLSRLAIAGYSAHIERGILILVEAFDWNCPENITPRFTREDIEASVEPLHQRIADLEAELADLEKSQT